MALCCHTNQHFLIPGSISQKHTLNGETPLVSGFGWQLAQSIIWQPSGSAVTTPAGNTDAVDGQSPRRVSHMLEGRNISSSLSLCLCLLHLLICGLWLIKNLFTFWQVLWLYWVMWKSEICFCPRVFNFHSYCERRKTPCIYWSHASDEIRFSWSNITKYKHIYCIVYCRHHRHATPMTNLLKEGWKAVKCPFWNLKSWNKKCSEIEQKRKMRCGTQGYFQAKMQLSYPSGGEGVGGAQLIRY